MMRRNPNVAIQLNVPYRSIQYSSRWFPDNYQGSVSISANHFPFLSNGERRPHSLRNDFNSISDVFKNSIDRTHLSQNPRLLRPSDEEEDEELEEELEEEEDEGEEVDNYN